MLIIFVTSVEIDTKFVINLLSEKTFNIIYRYYNSPSNSAYSEQNTLLKLS